jgi:hypothetical protein
MRALKGMSYDEQVGRLAPSDGQVVQLKPGHEPPPGPSEIDELRAETPI